MVSARERDDPGAVLDLVVRSVLRRGDELLLRLAEQAAAATGGIGAVVAAVAGDELRLDCVTGYPAEVVARFEPMALAAALPLTDAARAGMAVWIEDGAERAERYPALAGIDTGSTASASLPLRFEGRVIGVLGVSFRGDHTFTDPEREPLVGIADHCGVVIGLRRWAERGRRWDAVAATGVFGSSSARARPCWRRTTPSWTWSGCHGPT
jgi:GAF domain-containing protein